MPTPREELGPNLKKERDDAKREAEQRRQEAIAAKVELSRTPANPDQWGGGTKRVQAEEKWTKAEKALKDAKDRAEATAKRYQNWEKLTGKGGKVGASALGAVRSAPAAKKTGAGKPR